MDSDRGGAVVVEQAVVVGGGTMGAGIAASLLSVGVDVLLIETDPERAAVGCSAAERALQRIAERSASELVSGTLSSNVGFPAAFEAALVVEAVFEDLEVKRVALAEAESAFSGVTVLATNTSSLSIDALASGLQRPERLVGMHFFNPVPASSLVEIVEGAATARMTVERARAWVERLGKTAIVVRDSPGFATSRLGMCIGLEAIRMVEEGVASAEDIDTGMMLGYRFPMGPLRLGDLVGWDVRLAIAEYLSVELGPRFEPPQLLRDMVAAGKLGKKSGEGFYTW